MHLSLTTIESQIASSDRGRAMDKSTLRAEAADFFERCTRWNELRVTLHVHSTKPGFQGSQPGAPDMVAQGIITEIEAEAAAIRQIQEQYQLPTYVG